MFFFYIKTNAKKLYAKYLKTESLSAFAERDSVFLPLKLDISLVSLYKKHVFITILYSIFLSYFNKKHIDFFFFNKKIRYIFFLIYHKIDDVNRTNKFIL